MAVSEVFGGTARFEVQARLGAGGMGVVYRAFDRAQNRLVALKTLKTLSADAILRIKNEFRALQDMQHPNLVSFGELFSEAGDWFFTMELVEGVDFLCWVRPPGAGAPEISAVADTLSSAPHMHERSYEHMNTRAHMPLDEARLRPGLLQLAQGVNALHAAGKVHRDIKPSNVLVTPAGRVVLLDFGLTTDVGGGAFSEVNVVGTADYMAPEQAASSPAGPAADWYSVGVVLYEALTGRLPFQGSPLEVLIAKQHTEPPPPSTLAPVPPDLAALCVALLRPDPALRPPGPEILRRLGGDERPAELCPSLSQPSQAVPFIGRERERAALHEAFATTREGSAVGVLVTGESGVGKSALVRRFTDELRAEHPNVVVLAGRCYQRESVPYKAFDGIVDALSQYLARLPKAQASAFLALRTGLLAQAFPVLRRVEAIAEAPLRTQESSAPQEQRRRVFAAMRELFERMTARHPVALVIDDLQWADADSLALLGEILHPPDAPPLLVVATHRPVADHPAAQAPWAGVDLRRVPVERLPPEDGQALVQALMLRAAARELPENDARAIAEEARGHPLFIDELVRHLVAPSGDTGPGARLHLEQALWTRVRHLAPTARRLLELCVVAGTPLPSEAAMHALGVDAAELERHVGLLRVGNLVRSSGPSSIEPFHDRVRAAVLLNLDDDATRALHERLALALEASSAADPEALSAHWHGAGDAEKAGEYAAHAAEAAAAAFAFDRAARLWQSSLDLRPVSGALAAQRYRALGDALVNSGHGGEAALAYLEAAKHAQGADAIDLQRRASQQLLVSGHIDEGLKGARTVLGAVGLALAPTPQRAVASLLVRRATLRLRGFGFRDRTPDQVPPDQLRRIDVCWSIVIGLSMVDTVRAADFQARHLQLALRAGEPYRVARAFALEAAFRASVGGGERRHSERMLAAAGALAERIGDAHAIALTRLAEAVACYMDGKWRTAQAAADEALEMLTERCTDVNWELRTAAQFAMMSLAQRGDIAELTRRMPLLRRSARERGDLYANLILRTGLLTLCALASDEPARAREEMGEAIRMWSHQSFQLQHYWKVFGETSCDIYAGDGPAAVERLEAMWPALEASLLLRTQYVRMEAAFLRGRAHLAAAGRYRSDSPEWQRHLRQAEEQARRIVRERMAWTRPHAQVLQAAVEAARGQLAVAAATLDQAARRFDKLDMPLHAQVARRRIGQLVGGDAGRATVTSADAWMRARRVRTPQRLSALFAPGFAD